jgi:hypothetical protein
MMQSTIATTPTTTGSVVGVHLDCQPLPPAAEPPSGDGAVEEQVVRDSGETQTLLNVVVVVVVVVVGILLLLLNVDSCYCCCPIHS